MDGSSESGRRVGLSKAALSRQKLKGENPEKYAEYLQAQRERVKKRRDQLKKALLKKTGNEEALKKKAHQNKLQRERQKRYMEKKKQQGIKKSAHSTKATKPQTRNTIETKREYNRQKKRQERQEMSWQKKMWIRKKDRERKQEKRREAAKLKALSTPTSTVGSPVGSPFASKKTEYNITSKVRKSIPKSPTKFAKVMDNVLSKASPRKLEALEKLKTSKSTSARKVIALKQTLKSSKSSVIVAEHLAKQYRTGHIRHRTGSIMKRKSHVDRKSVQAFFLQEDISRVLPGKRHATKDGPGYAMQVSLKAAHCKYLAENPTKRVSLGKFAALRTKNVRLLRVSDREFCCCVYCINVRYKMLCLSRAVIEKDKKKTCETDVLDIVLCPKRDGQRYHDPDCINSNCSECRNYMDTLNQYYHTIPDDKQLTWLRWEYKETENGKRKRVVVTKRGNKQACLSEFVENDLKKPVQGISYFQHIHTAHWQNAQFNQIKNQLPTGDILQVMDFAKNREVKYQDEIKGAFYTASQITMHPIVTYYKSDTGLVRNSSIVISEDNDHDHYAVQHFQEIVDLELEKKLGASKPNRKVIFSDGCSSQYKSKGPFAELAFSKLVINRNYFGSEHGKSQCDAEIGVVNRCVDRAIVANQAVINNAEDLYKYCKENLESDSPFSKRTFHLVKLGEIDRERPDVMKAQTVQDTRKIHQALNLQTGNTFKVRNLSCFCMKCEAGNPDCLNSKYVNSYKEKTLVEQAKSRKTQAGESKKSKLEKPKSGEARQTDDKQRKSETVKQAEVKPKNDQTNAESERQQYFSSLLTLMELAGSEGFAKLKEVSSTLHAEMNDKYPLEAVDSQFSFAEGKYKADQIALTLIPEQIRTEGMLPVNVTADGNCLPRTGSILLFGNESAHEEMRLRIAIELCLNSDLYINNDYLNRGESFTEQVSKLLDQTYTMFSEQYVPGTKVTKTVTEKIFKEETVKICKRAEYMGIWQLFALSSVLQKKIYSLYPNIGHGSVKQVLNRNILPRQDDHSEAKVTVMWTSTRTDMEPQNWIPNHFVPLLPITRLSYFTDMGDLSGMTDSFDFSEEDADLSLDDTMMDTILNTLSNLDKPDGVAEDCITVCDKGVANDQHIVTEQTAQGDPAAVDENTVDEATRDEQEQDKQMFTDEMTLAAENFKTVSNDQHIVTEQATQGDLAAVDENTVDEATRDEQEQDKQMFTDEMIMAAENLKTVSNDQHIVTEQTTQGDLAAVDENTVDKSSVDQTAIDYQIATDYHDRTDDELVLSADDTTKYKVGDFLLANCGRRNFPCLVVQTPDDMESLPHLGVWVQYLKKARASLWTLEEKPFFIEYRNICNSLEPPSLTAAGTRIYYQLKFK